MRLIYTTTYQSLDVAHWSGTGYYIAKSLADAGANIEYCGGLCVNIPTEQKVLRRLYRLMGKRYLPERSDRVRRIVERNLKRKDFDDKSIFFSPGILASPGRLVSGPKVIYTDATFANLVNYYEDFTSLCALSLRKGMALERRLLNDAVLGIFSSQWAADSAINDYGVDEKKVRVIPFGANVIDVPNAGEFHDSLRLRLDGVCRLLFVAVDWQRKGGPYALELCQRLRFQGINVELHVIGVRDLKNYANYEWVVDHGFVKKDAEGYLLIKRIMISSNFLLLPSIADCTPMVIGEANAHYLPCLTSAVGGMGSLVQNEMNGYAYPLSEWCEQANDVVLDLLKNRDAYVDLCMNSRKVYEQKLNWSTSGKALIETMQEVIGEIN